MAKIPDKYVESHVIYSDGSTESLGNKDKVIGVSLGDGKVLISGSVNISKPEIRWYTRLWNRIRGKKPIYIDR